MTTLKVGDKVRLTGPAWAEDYGVEEEVVEITSIAYSGEGEFWSDGYSWVVPAESPVGGGEEWEFVDAGDSFEDKVDAVLADVKAKLIAKNNQYGNSALEPIRAFSKLNPVEQLLIRIDDKISRLQKGDGTGDEDAEADTLGYLILLAIARKDANA